MIQRKILMLMLCMMVCASLVSLPLLSSAANAPAFTSGVTMPASSTANFWFKPSGWTASYAILHYTAAGAGQQNVRMTYNSGTAQWEYKVPNLAAGTSITYSFTYNTNGLQYDSATTTYTVGGGSPNNGGNSSNNSIYSVAASSIPAPSGNGVMTFKVMNGTRGAYTDSQIYWCVLAINPDTKAWCYLDNNGNLIPISTGLNDAPGHLSKNGVNYANICHTISEKQWINLPKMTSARMYLSVGSPCYIKTYNTGFAAPDINNPTDPNRNIYFDFVEFTIDNSGYHGNTTRVDGFGFPIQHRLVNKSGNFDKTVGELESETRSGLFAKYQNEVPNEFKALATIQYPYRIVAPIHGSFAAGGANANYFAGYSNYSTQDILLGTNSLQQNPAVCAAINRHVYTLSNWNNVSNYYQAAPANYYAKFWHTHGINGLAYGFCYDDVNGQASYLSVGDPKGLIIRVGW